MGIDDILILAKNSGVTTLAITDHDCLAGTVRAELIGQRYGITVIPAVEFSATDKKRSSKAHILCYLPDKPERLEGLCKSNSELRKRAGRMMIMKVAKKFPVTPEFIMKCCTGSTNIYKQHIMSALMNAGYTTTIFGDLYKMLFSKESRINVLMEVTYPEPAEIIDAIHEAGGIAVLAHPGFYDNFELFEELIPLGLDGVEVWHPYHTEKQAGELLDFANQHDLLVTGGSDFHGMYSRTARPLGSTTVPDECVDALLRHKQKLAKKG